MSADNVRDALASLVEGRQDPLPSDRLDTLYDTASRAVEEG